jgi:hypothetical protein
MPPAAMTGAHSPTLTDFSGQYRVEHIASKTTRET